MSRYLIFLLLFFCWVPTQVGAQQERIFVHSHNDYYQSAPFYQAYAHGVYSVEVDVFAGEGHEVLVGHDPEELRADRTLESLYVSPIVGMFKANGGRLWGGSDQRLVLLIDLKTSAEVTLPRVVRIVERHPEVFDENVNPHAVRVVVSGSMPPPEQFADIPPFIWFDGRLDQDYTSEQLARIAFISAPFSQYAQWNGKGRIIETQHAQVQQAIVDAHARGKMIRFWGTPDGVTAWNTLHDLGVDIINTDRIEDCMGFFSGFSNKRVVRGGHQQDSGLAIPRKLDKVTQGFEGFSVTESNMPGVQPVYTPSGGSDGEMRSVRNLILMIGDGMGLAQLQAAHAFNNGLTILEIPTIGLQQTEAEDSYTSDSAAAGSALATGQKTKNRHISIDGEGMIRHAITHYTAMARMKNGIVTAGDVADATPAAFYGHAAERDDSDVLTTYLLDGKLDLLVGSGRKSFSSRQDGRDLWNELGSVYHLVTEVKDISEDHNKLICIDEALGNGATAQTVGMLAETTRKAITKLQSGEPNGFFLMVEGAKIDYAGHANALPASIMETLSFDLAVAEALRFADKDGHTLVIVTGDHETGGLTLIDGNPEQMEVTGIYVTDDHTPIMLPVFSYGPQSNMFSGVYQNTEIFHRIKKALNL